MEYFINSNTGDYISIDDNDVIKLHLIPRTSSPGGQYLPSEIIVINRAQLSALKGFVPIKKKKLFNRNRWYSDRNKYAPTLSDGSKGKSERVKMPTQSEVRDEILKQLGL